MLVHIQPCLDHLHCLCDSVRGGNGMVDALCVRDMGWGRGSSGEGQGCVYSVNTVKTTEMKERERGPSQPIHPLPN